MNTKFTFSSPAHVLTLVQPFSPSVVPLKWELKWYSRVIQGLIKDLLNQPSLLTLEDFQLHSHNRILDYN